MSGKDFNGFPEALGSPECYLCSSDLAPQELLGHALKIKGRGFVQLLDYDEKMLPRLLPAYLNARLRERDSIMRTSAAAMEMLLFVAGNTNITKAIGACGIKNGNSFLVFATDKENFDEFASQADLKSTKRIALKFDEDAAQEVARLAVEKD